MSPAPSRRIGRSVSTRLALAACLATLGACGGEGEVGPHAPTRGPGGGNAPPIAASAPSPSATASPARSPASRPASGEAPTSPPPGLGRYEVTELEAQEGAPARPAARNLGEELRAALGVPSECLPPEVAATLGAELRVPVRVWVTSSGRVTRAEVGGSVPASVRECVLRRAESISMLGPIEGAPRDVSTELVIAIRREDPAAPAAAPAWRAPEGAQPPAVTLPATAPPGPARGAVPPGSTLPAVAPEGRPAGFVPPSSTLPALAD